MQEILEFAMENQIDLYEIEANFQEAIRKLDAAKASGDHMRIVAACEDLLDMALDKGAVSPDALREMSTPHLPQMVKFMDSVPAGRKLLNQLVAAANEQLNGSDYRKKAGAALFIVTVNGAQAPRKARAAAKRTRNERKALANDLVRIQGFAEHAAMALRNHTVDFALGSSVQSDCDEAHRRQRWIFEKSANMLTNIGCKSRIGSHLLRRPNREPAE